MSQKHPPNVVMLMADQLTVRALAAYGNRVCRTPNLDRLFEKSTVFDAAYCASPICAPSRYAMLTGRLPSRLGAYDNSAELPAATPTLLHYLRRAGYATCLSGKMHFVGPDQLHGFEERLTTDIYPSDFGWTTNWRQLGRLSSPTGLNMRNVVESGACQRSLQIDYDDLVTHHAVQKVFDLAREDTGQPFFLTVSLTHPHNPYVAAAQYFALYNDADIDMPAVGALPHEARDDHSRRLHEFYRSDEYRVTEQDIVRTRRAYYGNVSYVDAQLGKVLDALADAGFAENTIVLFTADHGDMLGERGLWYKFNFFEPSVRVPLSVRLPGQDHGSRVAVNVSHLDILPTLLDLVTRGAPTDWVVPIEGTSVAPLLRGEHQPDRAILSEYASEGSIAPMVMVREGEHKLIACETDRPQLFHVASDPGELHNVWDDVRHAAARAQLQSTLARSWDLAAYREDALRSQATRRFLHDVLMTGKRNPWDFQPVVDASRQFVRSGGSPTAVKGKARFPFVPPKLPDFPLA